MKTRDITRILQEWSGGDRSAADRLFPLVYDELKVQAKKYLSRERDNHTLQPTALVHEAYLRLVDQTDVHLRDRCHFFAVAATVMRHILVDHARAVGAVKRGGTAKRLSLDEVQVSTEECASDLLALDAALRKLSEEDDRKGRVVEMCYFGGMKQSEVAEVLGVDPRTVRNDLTFAKLWLLKELTASDG
ncbi:MAG: sigma-70 family RNA polymerase sigma factor [Aridibacter famidurans]|nr:sigma-70 family RNA polymerase sigma factor [Aridibacter famidurans]